MATFGQPTEDSYARAKEYLCSSAGTGCLKAVRARYMELNPHMFDGFDLTCIGDEISCTVPGFQKLLNLNAGYQYRYYIEPKYVVSAVDSPTW